MTFETLYFGQTQLLNRGKDVKLLQALLAASKKAITRKWLNPAPPLMEEWFGIIFEIYKMEKLTYCLRIQKVEFDQIWANWTDFCTLTQIEFCN